MMKGTAFIAYFFEVRTGLTLSKGRDPLHSIRLITSLNIYPSITAVPDAITSTFSSSPAPPSIAYGAAVILHAALCSSFSDALHLPSLHPLVFSQLNSDETLRSRLFLASLMTPYAHVQYIPPKKKSVVEVIIREGLKLGLRNHFADGVPALFAAADVLRRVDASQFEGPGERSRIG